MDRALAPLGLTHAQYAVLSSLSGMQREGLVPSQRALADHTGLEPLYVSKLARALETDGLIERTRDPVDTRAVRLSLTTRGSEVAGEAIAIVHPLLDRLTEPLGERVDEFVRELNALLDVSLDPTE